MVAHSTLTGSNLHEPKGVATAVTGDVYIADGLGSGNWTALDATFNSFANAMLHVSDDGATPLLLTNDDWTARPLPNLEVNQISGASLAASRITLPGGTYFIMGTSVVYSEIANGATNLLGQMRLWNVTDNAAEVTGITVGQSIESFSAQAIPCWLHTEVMGKFTIGGFKTFEVQSFAKTSAGVDRYTGQPAQTLRTCNVFIWNIG